MNAGSIKIECEEDGFYLVIVHEPVEHSEWIKIEDPEALYDHVRGTIGAWLKEGELARREFRCDPDESAGAYELSDPKHPDFHSVHADIWDSRAGK